MTLEEAQKNYQLAAAAGNTERAVYLAKQIRAMQLHEQPKTLKDVVSKKQIEDARSDPKMLAAKLQKHLEKSKAARKEGNKKLADEHAQIAKELADRLEATKR